MDIYKLNFTVLEQEIFSFLCVKTGQKLSQREIAKNLGVSPTAVANATKTLKEQELINIEKTKTINFISFNRNNHKAIQLKRVENLKTFYISGLFEFLEEQLAGATIILFGSYARGEDIHTSDIDIAVIGRKNKPINIDKFKTTLQKSININFYTSFNDINKNLRNNILNGIVMTGSVDL